MYASTKDVVLAQVSSQIWPLEMTFPLQWNNVKNSVISKYVTTQSMKMCSSDQYLLDIFLVLI